MSLLPRRGDADGFTLLMFALTVAAGGWGIFFYLYFTSR